MKHVRPTRVEAAIGFRTVAVEGLEDSAMFITLWQASLIKDAAEEFP